MESHAFEVRVADIKQRAHGYWTDLLRTLGIDDGILNKRNQPCPLCGGEDRFQYTDKYGDGNYHCRGCGPGGGLKLLQGVHGGNFITLLERIEQYLGVAAPAQAQATLGSGKSAFDRMKKLAKRIWDEAKPVVHGDEVDRYLFNRGLSLAEYPKVLRFHPALGYYEKDASGTSRKVAEHPAMLACIQGADGHAVTLHRTYLPTGDTGQQCDTKKVLSPGINGAAIRLFEATEELAVAEGIETALAIYLSTHKPVWAAINAGNMEKLWVPDSARRICIYGDNDSDASYDGQACAYSLARRLKKESKASGARQVDVFIPRYAGTDWADVWCTRLQSVRKDI